MSSFAVSHEEDVKNLPLDVLIHRTAVGCRASFDQVYRETNRTVFGVLMLILRNHDDAKDALQDVYARVWVKSSQFKSTGSDPRAWIRVIARNTAINHIRSRKKTVSHDQFEDVHEDPRGASYVDRLTLHKCLERLDPSRVELVKLVYLEGSTYDDIVERYNAPLNTVKSWIRRSLLHLKSCMSKGE